MSDERQQIDAIFCEAIEIESADQRDVFLQEACGGDATLRAQLENLLQAHFRAGSFLDRPAPELPATTVPDRPIEHEGRMIGGRYKLREQLGEGGFGVVWAAEQIEPVARKVAIKIIKPGMDSREIIARFEAEQQALAMMDHPNIATVLDAGTTEQGRPYFVMELIRGAPITEYCDKAKLSIRDRLRLFISVCEAVQHAHQKAIIHRDIKPSNVLITLHNGAPVVKIIDFGVAKALNRRLTEKTIYTRVFQAIGTLAYMSPEQAELSGHDIDTRADIYGLGTLLYELLTGTTPFSPKRLESAAFLEACRIIREEEPPKASVHISSLGGAARTVSHSRDTEPEKLQKSIKGDLDCIVLKALAKDRRQRYDTASDFASDVERYLNSEPVVAHPPSTVYRMRRFVRRRRGHVIATSIVMLALIVGASAKVSEWVRVADIQAQLSTLLIKLSTEYAIGGDLDRAGETISAAVDAGASEDWNPIIHCMGALFSGKSIDAVEQLREVVESDPTNVVALGVMSAAHLYTGSLSAAMDAMSRLRETDPKTEYEYLFRGYPEIYEDSATAERYLRLAVSRRDNWPLAHAMLAEALAQRCLDEPDKTRAMDYAREAIEYSNRARGVLKNNPYVICIQLHTHHVAIRRGRKWDKETSEWEALATAAAADLEPFDKFIQGRWIRGAYYEFLDEPGKAEADYRAAVEAGAGSIYKGYLASFLFKHNRVKEAFAATGQSGTQLAFADLPDSKARALEFLENPKSEESPYFRIWSPELLGYLGDRREAKKRWESFDRQDANTGFYFLDYPLQIFAEMTTPEELLLADNLSNCHRSAIYFFAGRYHLYHGDHEKAAAYFRECVNTDVFTHAYLSLSKGILARLADDQDWPSFK